MKLIKVELIGIYGYFNKTIDFKKDENFLVGINGSGKSTVLKIIHEFFNENYSYFKELVFDNIRISYKIGDEKYLYELARNFENIKIDLTPEELEIVKDDNGIVLIDYRNDQLIPLEVGFEFIENANVLTLGMEREIDDEKINDFFKSLKNNKPFKSEIYNILTPLEKISKLLEEKGNEFLQKKSLFFEKQREIVGSTMRTKSNTLFKSLIKNNKKINNNKKEHEDLFMANFIESTLESLFSYEIPNDIEQYLKVINSFFKETCKEMFFDTKKGEFYISILDEKQSISYEITDFKKLSSGEKQLLILLTNLAYTELSNFIVIMDEPEISLHMAWQKILFKNLKKLLSTKNCQFIVATHSPDITRNVSNDKYIPCYPYTIRGEK